jgi:starch synthase
VNILLATTEAVPFAKTGGLGDVAGALPNELARLGHQVSVVMPAFRHIYQPGRAIEGIDAHFDIPVGGKSVRGRVLKSMLPGDTVPVYFIDQPTYFDRETLYGEGGKDYNDNCERFVFFSRAVLELIRLLKLQVDVVHANDWQTGLVPAYLATEYREKSPEHEKIASVLTIHNMAYQGRFWHWDMLLTGLDWSHFNWRELEFYGDINLLKAGIVYADEINTVSPRYAQEIQTAEHGCGLEGVLQGRSHRLRGIINGIDENEWNPATDPHIARHYNAHSWGDGKQSCKASLQKELHLSPDLRAPVIGMVGRLASQKGWDLIVPLIERWIDHADVQWAILGSGDPIYQAQLQALAAKHPGKIGVRLEFSNALAHRIEAGSDIFLMPSRYEPCGLNQLYSLRYGTVPVVHKTGGLADTIVNLTPETKASRTATGFAFDLYHVDSLADSLHFALECYRHDPQTWGQLIETGIRQDWTWTRSAREYVTLYEDAIRRKLG